MGLYTPIRISDIRCKMRNVRLLSCESRFWRLFTCCTPDQLSIRLVKRIVKEVWERKSRERCAKIFYRKLLGGRRKTSKVLDARASQFSSNVSDWERKNLRVQRLYACVRSFSSTYTYKIKKNLTGNELLYDIRDKRLRRHLIFPSYQRHEIISRIGTEECYTLKWPRRTF